jgi:small subunit ribosomal protein S16
MLKIKLARFGKRGQPHYRIVINEARDKRDGSYVEMIGHYAPTQTPKILEVDTKKYDAWVAKGAQPTDTVRSLVEKFKSGNPFPAKKPQLSRKAKAKLAAAKEAEAEAKNQPAEEKPAEVEAPVEAEAPAEVETPTEETK